MPWYYGTVNNPEPCGACGQWFDLDKSGYRFQLLDASGRPSLWLACSLEHATRILDNFHRIQRPDPDPEVPSDG